jgi:hypothetical protein
LVDLRIVFGLWSQIIPPPKVFGNKCSFARCPLIPTHRYCHHRERTERETGEVILTMKISIKVQSGAARFDVAVVAESVEQALMLVGERYSASDVRVKSPTGPIGLSVGDPNAPTGSESSRPADAIAA